MRVLLIGGAGFIGSHVVDMLVASGHEVRVLDATALTAAAGNGGPKPEVVAGYRTGDVRHVFAAPDRARTELDFTAHMPFEQGIRDFASAPLRG